MARRRTKGSGNITKDSRTGVFSFRWVDDTGKVRKKSLRTKNRQDAEKQALAYEKVVKAQDKEEVLFQAAKARKIIKSRDLPLREVWDNFLKTNPTAGVGTLKLYKRALNEFIDWLAIEYPSINSFTQLELQIVIAYTDNLWESGISASTYNDKRNALGHITKGFQNKYNIDANYWILKELRKKGVQQKRNPLNRKQVSELLKLLDTPSNGLPYPAEISCLVKLCLFAGMRLCDAVNIKWDNVNFETGYISYTPEKTKRTSGATAQVPILPPLHNALSNFDHSGDYVLPQIQAHYIRNSDYIKENMIKAIHAITGDQRNEDVAQSKRKRSLYGAHSLRHTFCTEAAKAGANSVQLRTMTGDRISTLDKFYLKLDRTQKPVTVFKEVLITPEQKQLAASEPQREQLKQLADSLPIDIIKSILSQLKGE